MREPLVSRVDDARGVALVTLDRDVVRNAMNPAMAEQLQATFVDISDDPTVRVVVLTGEGRAFSAGADIDHMGKLAQFTYDENFEDSLLNDALFRTISECHHPVIARVNGHAIGGGSALVACADIAIAARHARFGFGEVRVGIAPAVISTFVVPKIGLSAARRWMLTGAHIHAEAAKSIGLVHEVVDSVDLDATVAASVAEVLAAWPSAQRATKALLGTWATSGREEYRGRALDVASRVRSSDEGRRGMQAFLDDARERSQARDIAGSSD